MIELGTSDENSLVPNCLNIKPLLDLIMAYVTTLKHSVQPSSERTFLFTSKRVNLNSCCFRFGSKVWSLNY